MPAICQNIKIQYDQIKTLRNEFVSTYVKALKTRNQQDRDEARILQNKLIAQREALQNMLWPFEELKQKEFKEQYESQKEIFQRVGILERLSTGEMGIKGIDNKEYTLPTCQELSARMKNNKEILKIKTEQGFKKSLITPFGLSLDKLMKIYGQLIIKHFGEGKLFDSNGQQITGLRKQGEGDEPKNDAAQDKKYYPLWKWEEYTNADIDGKLVYEPEEFTDSHQGKTKQEILSKQGGFIFSLIEDLPNIPRATKGETINGRKQLEAGKSPEEYLGMLKTDPQYQNEQGMTPEEQLICAIIHLEQTNQVLDDFQNKGSISYQLGAYFVAGGDVPYARWVRGDRRAGLRRDVPKYRSGRYGIRGRVGVL